MNEPSRPPTPDPHAVQGNLAGFNKDNQRFLFLAFPDAASGRAFLAEMVPDIASAAEVQRFNSLFREIHERRGGASDIVKAAWTNIALSAAGLRQLGAPGLDSMPDDFAQGMRARAALIGDRDDSDPTTWIAPFNQELHALVILAADQPEDLQALTDRVRLRIEAHRVANLGALDGTTRPDPFRGHEHFSFKDGISQPGIAGITGPRHDAIATGEFLIGYPDVDGNVSGSEQPPGPPPQPGEPGYPSPGRPGRPALPEWMRDGSFVVFRRLRQDVAAFRAFIEGQSTALGMPPEQLRAKLVGRWDSGAPLDRVPGVPPQLDPSATDPTTVVPGLQRHLNEFDYSTDPDGERVPRAAHIRKANPRAEDPPGQSESRRHRILRRGIPYGPEFQETEPPYGGEVPPDQDRGLLFLCYQASIERGFEFVQRAWANTPDFPRPADGRDPIISQDVAERDFMLPPHGNLQLARWVTTAGGDYFFAPSIPALAQLSSQS